MCIIKLWVVSLKTKKKEKWGWNVHPDVKGWVWERDKEKRQKFEKVKRALGTGEGEHYFNIIKDVFPLEVLRGIEAGKSTGKTG